MEPKSKVDSTKTRVDHEPPDVTSKFGWRYHHLGIPTDSPKPSEKYLKDLKMYVSGFDKSPYGIEWMRFEPDSPVSDLVKTVPHIAFEVKNLETALEGKKMIGDKFAFRWCKSGYDFG